jgi:hypothetical protein
MEEREFDYDIIGTVTFNVYMVRSNEYMFTDEQELRKFMVDRVKEFVPEDFEDGRDTFTLSRVSVEAQPHYNTITYPYKIVFNEV